MKFLKEIFPFVVIVVAVILFRTFIITPVRVDGHSMDPTLEHNEILLLKKYDRNFERFSIVVIDYQGEKLIKRIVGLPNEHVRYEGNTLYINGVEVKEDFIDTTTSYFDLKNIGYDVIPEGYYFVVGDNRSNSKDSRVIGLISKKDIIGTVDFALFPFRRFGKVK